MGVRFVPSHSPVSMGCGDICPSRATVRAPLLQLASTALVQSTTLLMTWTKTLIQAWKLAGQLVETFKDTTSIESTPLQPCRAVFKVEDDFLSLVPSLSVVSLWSLSFICCCSYIPSSASDSSALASIELTSVAPVPSFPWDPGIALSGNTTAKTNFCHIFVVIEESLSWRHVLFVALGHGFSFQVVHASMQGFLPGPLARCRQSFAAFSLGVLPILFVLVDSHFRPLAA